MAEQSGKGKQKMAEEEVEYEYIPPATMAEQSGVESGVVAERKRKMAEEEVEYEYIPPGKRIAREAHHGLVVEGSVEIYRRSILVNGMKIWGSFSRICKKDVVISLPRGLRGFVAASEVSDAFGKRYGRRPTAGRPLLSELFGIGQLVPCTVKKVEVIRKPSGRRIELSLKLKHFYNDLSIEALHTGQALFAVVTEVKDDGYGLSFGVADLSGTLLHENTHGALCLGQIVQVVIISVEHRDGLVDLMASSTMDANNMLEPYAGSILTPGAMVNARIREVLRDGLLLSFSTDSFGTVDIFHLEDALPGVDWSTKYEENQSVRARILSVDPSTKTFGLTLNLQLLNNVTPVVPVDIGEVFQSAIVRRVDATIGMLLELPTRTNVAAAGYVHISDVSDGYIAKVEEKFKVGDRVRARVTGYRYMDALATASLLPHP